MSSTYIALPALTLSGPITVVGPIAVTQSTSPWIISGAVTGPLTDTQLRATPVPVSGAFYQAIQPVSQSGTWSTGRTWTLSSVTDSVAITGFPSTIGVTQDTSPWVVSGTVLAQQSGTWNITDITGTVSLPTGASTSALQVAGNASLASIDSKLTSPITVTGPLTDAQLRASPVPVSGTVAATQSGSWTTGRTWTLSSGTDSVNIGNFPATVAVTQSTSPWVVSGTITANQGTSPWVENLTQVGGASFALGQQLAAASLPVVLTASQLSTLTPLSTVAVTQSTSPWVVSGTVLVSNLPTTVDTNYGTVGANTLRSAAQIGNATGAADFNAGATGAQTLRVVANAGTGTFAISAASLPLPTGASTSALQTQPGVDIGDVTINNASGAGAVNIQDGGNSITVDGTVSVSGTVAVTQSTSPWIVSGTVATSNFPTTVDTNYGTVGANTLRTAAQIGNATGAAAFNAGTTTAQTLRVVLPTDQTAIPATQSGTWSVRTQDGAGNLLTSQVNGTQRALDVGIDVAGVQIDPRAASPGTITNRSGTATNVVSTVMAANSARKYLFFQNISTVTMYINFTTSATVGVVEIQVAPGNTFVMENNFISTEALTVIVASGSRSYVAKEG